MCSPWCHHDSTFTSNWSLQLVNHVQPRSRCASMRYLVFGLMSTHTDDSTQLVYANTNEKYMHGWFERCTHKKSCWIFRISNSNIHVYRKSKSCKIYLSYLNDFVNHCGLLRQLIATADTKPLPTPSLRTTKYTTSSAPGHISGLKKMIPKNSLPLQAPT